MRWLAIRISEFGNYIVSLSDRTRLTVVVIALILLGGTSIYKLTVNIQRMKTLQPAASTDEFTKPMEQLVRETTAEANAYQKSRQRGLKQLDSLKFYYNQAKPKQ